jgi:hypothetical protein
MTATAPCALVIIDGFHPTSLTHTLLVPAATDPVLQRLPLFHSATSGAGAVLSPFRLRDGLEAWWQARWDGQPWPHILIWAFSAGCLGAAGLAQYWHHHRGQVLALFAVDGWGVPLVTDYPIYRISHDRFTHVTSLGLGAGAVNFYADPPVPHLDVWTTPATVDGWQVTQASPRWSQYHRLTAAEFLRHWSRHHSRLSSDTA